MAGYFVPVGAESELFHSLMKMGALVGDLHGMNDKDDLPTAVDVLRNLVTALMSAQANGLFEKPTGAGFELEPSSYLSEVLKNAHGAVVEHQGAQNVSCYERTRVTAVLCVGEELYLGVIQAVQGRAISKLRDIRQSDLSTLVFVADLISQAESGITPE